MVEENIELLVIVWVLKNIRVGFHFSEVKGPVMDRLQRSDFLEHLNGQVFLSQYQAVQALVPGFAGAGVNKTAGA